MKIDFDDEFIQELSDTSHDRPIDVFANGEVHSKLEPELEWLTPPVMRLDKASVAEIKKQIAEYEEYWNRGE